MVRWATPVTHFRRTATRDGVRIGDIELSEGDKVVLWYRSANRDQDVFDEPHRFDITKPREAPPLTFGFGAHFCIGANLARAELAETFTYLAPRMPGLRLAGEPVYGPVTGIYAIESLPLAWRASPVG